MHRKHRTLIPRAESNNYNPIIDLHLQRLLLALQQENHALLTLLSQGHTFKQAAEILSSRHRHPPREPLSLANAR